MCKHLKSKTLKIFIKISPPPPPPIKDGHFDSIFLYKYVIRTKLHLICFFAIFFVIMYLKLILQCWIVVCFYKEPMILVLKNKLKWSCFQFYTYNFKFIFQKLNSNYGFDFGFEN